MNDIQIWKQYPERDFIGGETRLLKHLFFILEITELSTKCIRYDFSLLVSLCKHFVV